VPPSNPKSGKAEPCSSNQLTLIEMVARSAKFSLDSPQAKELNCAVTYYIAKDFVLILKVEKQYQMPSRCHFTNYDNYSQNFVVASLNNSFFLAQNIFGQVPPASHT